MGKNFPRIITLKQDPSYFQKTIKLIEESFKYHAPFTFTEDFAPLIDESNFKNCFIMIDESENVIAHIGVKDKEIEINNHKFTVSLLGGIAVDEKHRGEGLFQDLFTEVISEKRDDCALFILWSDIEKLYKKFGFYLCGNQFEVSQAEDSKSFLEVKYYQLTSEEKAEIQKLYEQSFANNYLTFKRSASDWEIIEKIKSADLYIKKDAGKIYQYFFMNKGQDLGGVIYEYGGDNLKDLFETARSYGKIWAGSPLVETDILQYQFFMCPGSQRQFSSLIRHYTNQQFEIREINLMKQEVFFDFNQETLVLSVEEFLRGIFGPGNFEELGDLRPFFISGLDSI
ncbi:MAG: GNAT family N-acetyltransferase [Bacteriovoracaceae bacterium]